MLFLSTPVRHRSLCLLNHSHLHVETVFKTFKNKTQVIYKFCAVGDHCPCIHAANVYWSLKFWGKGRQEMRIWTRPLPTWSSHYGGDKGIGPNCQSLLELQENSAGFYVRKHSISVRNVCGGQRTDSGVSLPTSLRQGFFVVCSCICQASWPSQASQTSGDSPVSASHLSVGVPELQTCTNISSITWLLGIWTWVFRLVGASNLVSELHREFVLCAWWVAHWRLESCRHTHLLCS